ncbi:hypothetical protein Tco_1119502 [Tanacetum coccineum]
MPTLDIPIPAYSSDESIKSSIPLVILSDTETDICPKGGGDCYPAPLHIVPTPPGLPRLPVVLVLLVLEIPFDRPYRTHLNEVRRMLTERKRVRPPPSLLLEPSSEYSSRHSSLGVLLPTSSSSDGPSRKGGRSHTTSLLGENSIEGSSEIGHETYIEADMEVGTEVSVEASVRATIEIVVDVTAEPNTPPVLPEQTITERVRSLELSELSFRDTLRVERERGFPEFSVIWGMFQRIMPTTQSGMTPGSIEEMITQWVVEALETHEANRNNRNIIESGDENKDENEGGMETVMEAEMEMEMETVMDMVMEMEMEEEMETGMVTMMGLWEVCWELCIPDLVSLVILVNTASYNLY